MYFYLLFEIILPERWISARLVIASICSFCSLCYLVWLSVQSKLYAVNGRNLVYFWGTWLWLFVLIKKMIFTLLSRVNMNQVNTFLVWLDVNQQQLEIEVIFSYLHACFSQKAAFDLCQFLMVERATLREAVWLLWLCIADACNSFSLT